MKFAALFTMTLAGLCLTGCAGSTLDQIVEANHQQRIDESNADRPIARGARDGVGAYSADYTQKRLTLSSDEAP